MVKYSTLRTASLVIGVLGTTWLIVTKASAPAKVVGILFFIILIVVAFAVTGKYRRYIIGEEMEGSRGSFGRG